MRYETLGTYTVSAVYTGDGSNGSSSGAVIEYVQAPSTTGLTTSGSPVVVGQPVTFTATVTVAPKNGTVPDGELVTFYDGSKEIGTGTTASGVATVTTSALAAVHALHQGHLQRGCHAQAEHGEGRAGGVKVCDDDGAGLQFEPFEPGADGDFHGDGYFVGAEHTYRVCLIQGWNDDTWIEEIERWRSRICEVEPGDRHTLDRRRIRRRCGIGREFFSCRDAGGELSGAAAVFERENSLRSGWRALAWTGGVPVAPQALTSPRKPKDGLNGAPSSEVAATTPRLPPGRRPVAPQHILISIWTGGAPRRPIDYCGRPRRCIRSA